MVLILEVLGFAINYVLKTTSEYWLIEWSIDLKECYAVSALFHQYNGSQSTEKHIVSMKESRILLDFSYEYVMHWCWQYLRRLLHFIHRKLSTSFFPQMFPCRWWRRTLVTWMPKLGEFYLSKFLYREIYPMCRMLSMIWTVFDFIIMYVSSLVVLYH